MVVIVAGLYTVFSGRYIATENAYIHAPLVNIAPDVSGRIDQVLVEENQPVSRGELLLQIDPSPYRIAVERAEAQLNQAANSIRTLKASYATRQEELALAEENVSYSQREFARQQTLAKRNLTSQSELEKYRHDLATARRQRDTTDRDLKRIAASLGGKVDLPLEQHPDYQAAQASMASARLDLEHTRIRAPFAGIASKTPDPGTYASAGSPVMNLVGNRDLWIEANFKETELTRMHPGQAVTVEVDTYPDREFAGHVESIAQATGSEFSVLPAQNASGNWVKVVQRIPVRIRLDEPSSEAALRAGMSTEVTVDTGYPHNDFPLVVWLRGLVAEAHAADQP
ncbi:HlyD family secretion protein [Marinobacter nanhaiticus D15-8W]|nr:HlyD family secretion protein [Marinobacter nanhaiticus D15-8W]